MDYYDDSGNRAVRHKAYCSLAGDHPNSRDDISHIGIVVCAAVTDDIDRLFTSDDIAAFDHELLRQAAALGELADHDVANSIADRMIEAMNTQSCTKTDAFIAVTALITAILASEHCAECRRLHGARMIALACAAAERGMDGTRH